MDFTFGREECITLQRTCTEGKKLRAFWQPTTISFFTDSVSDGMLIQSFLLAKHFTQLSYFCMFHNLL